MDILIVEGKHDYERIKRLFPNLLIITTNGSETSENTINLIKEYAKNNEIIIFTDPDYPGERIRKKIKNICPKAKEVFINRFFIICGSFIPSTAFCISLSISMFSALVRDSGAT